ncbi:MAG: AF1514 family protein [Deltaproteobacteria bacterium]|nr:AF1514 family protein [Deltaproteobacteria bacterium]
MTGVLAAAGNPDAALVTWFDKEKNQHWPEDVGPDTEEFKRWRFYGIHHGGRLEIHVNDGQYIMMYS